MEAGIHELSAGYALDALDPAEREEFERHLAACERVPGGPGVLLGGHERARRGGGRPEPPPALRERILEAARAGAADRRFVRHRGGGGVAASLAAAAAIAAAVAIGLGIYAISLNNSSTTPTPHSPPRRSRRPCSPIHRDLGPDGGRPRLCRHE